MLSYSSGLDLLLVLNAAGSVGRVVPGLLADRLGPLTVFAPTAAVSALCLLCWPALREGQTVGLYVWAVFYGFAAGGVQGLLPAGLASLTPDLRKMGVRLGMVFTTNSLAVLVGPPIAGALISVQAGRYVGAQLFSGVVMLLGAGFMCAARVARARNVEVGGSRANI